MKKIIFTTLLLLFILLLPSCEKDPANTDTPSTPDTSLQTATPNTPTSPDEPDIPDVSVTLDAPAAPELPEKLGNVDIMNVTVEFHSEEKTVGEMLKEIGCTAPKYAVIDLDSDGDGETVLWLDRGDGYCHGFVILREEGERTFAYYLWLRQFNELKADGTFSFSGGVADHGIGRISFSGGDYEINETAYCESEDSNTVLCFIEDRSASKEEFDAFVTQWNKKPDAAWNDLRSA